jgi:hypothetical protein
LEEVSIVLAAARHWVLPFAVLSASSACTAAPAEDCGPLQRDAIQLVAASNTCTRDEDCALYMSKLVCKGLGYNNGTDPTTFEPKVAAFVQCVERVGSCPSCTPARSAAALRCKANYVTTSAPCRSGRCSDDVDAYVGRDGGP